ncbi:beta-ketoacyl-ACP synthase III [Pseudogulbenkiania ferrooxidans]|uniref:Beta-ketoacyl-acyl-carrier-protein synthase I n=1 Tax=Pseudogulbenkiania ferrooxidans 2002 TaxID=279714 RepID=B9YZL4_9NEIS|nr:beta-ketoacyl-ACP synthase III [Pseudogulbenkiania ferrooxidans]EEG10567.1 Beta-ketoacyl-acyl-carrier-protein synthase I [Pseudogulbenkiania ferrooxidans 2002]
MHKVVISGTGLFTPPHAVGNEQLVAAFNQYAAHFNAEQAEAIAAGEVEPLAASSAEFIEKASGIRQRFLMDAAGVLDPARMAPRLPERGNEALSLQAEMALAAAREALAQAGRLAEDVDLVIAACSNLPRPYPALAIEVQRALGIQGYAFDMNVACSSATFGIHSAVNAIQCGQARAVLMVNPEICSAHLNFRDRDSHFIFGDACTAVLLERADLAASANVYEVLGTRLATAFSNNIRNNFGFLNRCDESGIGRPDKLFHQQGRKVFKEVCPMVGEHIVAHLEQLAIRPDDVRCFWLHQANLAMNQLIARRVLGREAGPDEAPVILDRYGNTSSAGSIIAFHLHKDRLRTNDVGVICSFGAGYSVGSVVLKQA